MAGKNTFGGTVKLDGESEYKKALSTITTQLSVVSSAMTKVNAEFGKNSSSMEGLTAKNKVLNDQVQKQSEKVETLRGALEKSKELYGENDTKTLKWQVSLNKAEAELIKTNKEIEDNEKAMKDSGIATDKNSDSIREYGKSTEDAGKKTLSLGDIIKANLTSEAIIAGIKSLAGVVKEIGSAVVNVSKEAINSYADYEQLVGGVETLFKKSSNVVVEYANNAYKTSGLSANDYMTTVTSFSASLLQSLDGDTAKSAQVADMAITDMSDNANKMGTSMESIQTAYQGFAKQNYTMLDNLKLGYGGTKTEMERLLSDATKISGVKYDISSLNDVYQAIHVVQTELGITGTTAKEASTTISGSISSMKSSWSNLLTGLADGNADIQGLVTNVVDSALTVADNILPVIEQVAGSILEVLPKILESIIANLPKFLETGSNILTSIITGLQSNMPAIMNAVIQIINMLTQTIIQNLPQILQMGIELIISLVQGIAQQLPVLIPQMIDALLMMVTTLLDNIDLIIDAGIELIIGLAEGLLNALPSLIDKIPVIIDKLITAIVENLPKIIEMGIELIIKLAIGLVKAIPQLVSKIPEIITSLINGIKNYFSKMLSIGGDLLGKVKDGIVNGISGMLDVGKDLVQGLWNGINNAKDWVLDKIKGFGKAILDGIKGFFGIHSPSTVFKDEIGKNLALGIGEGFSDEMDDITSDMQNAIPKDFDLGVNTSISNGVTGLLPSTSMMSHTIESSFNYDTLVSAFTNALTNFKGDVILDDEKVGSFVTKTVEGVVFG